jgi:hypothetical protein
MVVVVVYLALLQEPPFLTLLRLRALLVVAPLNGVAHGRHGGRSLGVVWFGGCLVRRCDRREVVVVALEILAKAYR